MILRPHAANDPGANDARTPTGGGERKWRAVTSVRVRAGLVTFTGVPAASMAAFQKTLGIIDWGRGK